MKSYHLIIALLIFAATVNAPIQSALFKSYMVQNGLNDERIHCVFQDSKGWIWVGTDYGVSKFDGYEFFTLDLGTQISETLAKTLIRKIIEDSLGNLWIGTDIEGIFQYNPAEYKLSQYLKGESVWEIYEPDCEHLWLGTTNGFISVNKNEFKVNESLNEENSGLSGNFIRKIYVDQNKKIWLGTENGISVLNSDFSHCKNYLPDDCNIALENEVWDIYKDNRNQIWVGTYLGGLKKFDAFNEVFIDFNLDKLNDRSETVRTITQDQNGDLWFGTRGGLYNLENKSGKINKFEDNIQDEKSLIHNSILSLFIDKKGDLWIGTRNGLSYLNFNNKAFGSISANNSQKIHLNNSEVYELWEDAQNRLWIGTESGGVNIYDSRSQSIRYLQTANGLSNNCVKSIASDGLGNVLIGTYLGGLNQYNPITGTFKIFKNIPDDVTSISDDAVWDIYKDSQNRIWVATSSGADIFDPIKGTFKRMGKKYDLGWVETIHEDMEGNLWMFSTENNILTRIYVDGHTETFSIEARTLCNDFDGNVWIGTMGVGLLKFNMQTKTFKTYTVDDGLCSNIIYGIVRADKTYLWLSTNNGLSRLNIENGNLKTILLPMDY